MLTGGDVKVADLASEQRVVGICSANCGTTGLARVITKGVVACSFDNATVAGDYVQPSSLVNGYCTDAGSARPTTGRVLGYVLSTNTGSGTYDMLLEPDSGDTNSSYRAVRYNYLAISLINNASAPTEVNKLVRLAADGSVELAPVGASSRVLGVCRSSCGAAGAAEIATRGTAACDFDGAATIGHYVQLSTTVAGECTDAGDTRPTSDAILGYVLAGVASAGTGTVLLEPDVR
jgi:hypothetical protein